MNALEIKNIKKSYKDFTLDNINLSLPAGYITGLVGENGAGKSTLIKLIMNAVKKDSGEITVLGCKNTEKEFKNVKEDIGIVLEEGYFPECINVNQVNTIMKNTYKNWDEKYFFELIDKFSLPLKKKFNDFSRGMRMKLSIAAALSHRPQLLILDEATSGLDPIVRDEILEILYDFTRDENHSVLISSHIISDLEKLCDYIAFLHKGKLLFCEEKDKLLEEYVVVKCEKKRAEEIDPSIICGKHISGYSSEILVKRKDSAGFDYDKPTIEDIILFFAKKEN